MSKAKVSIIIPTYKRPGMLGRAINSCLNQTYEDIEVIIVDDNDPFSKERLETEEFMTRYSNISKLRYIKRNANGGGCASRNTGIEQAKGKYICFLDDDDEYKSNKIEEQINFMLKNGLDVCFCGSETYDESKMKIVKVQTHPLFEKYDNILKYHLVEMIVSPQTFMYKTSVIKKIGGFDDVKAGQEYYLMYKTILQNYKIGCLHEVLVRLYVHLGERITTSKEKINAEKNLYNLKKQHFNILNFSQRRQVKYTYKYNIWKKYKSSNSFKQYFYLLYIVCTHFILIIKRKVFYEKS